MIEHNLDRTTLKILAALQHDASNQATRNWPSLIGRVAPHPAPDRVKQLEDSGYIIGQVILDC